MLCNGALLDSAKTERCSFVPVRPIQSSSVYLSLMKFGVAADPPVSSLHGPQNCPWNFCAVVMGAPPWIIEYIFLQWSTIWLNGRGRWELFPIAPVLFSRDWPPRGGQPGRLRASCGGRPPSLSSLAFSTFPLLHHFSYLVFPAPLHPSCLSVGVTSHPASAVSLSPSPPPRGFPSNQSSDRNVIIGLMVYFIPQSLFELTAVILGHNKLNHSKINFGYECRTT